MQTMDSSQGTDWTKSCLMACGGCLVLVVCLTCLSVALFSGGVYYAYTTGALDEFLTPSPPATRAATAVALQPATPTVPSSTNETSGTPFFVIPTPTLTPAPNIGAPETIEQGSVPASAFTDLQELLKADYPPHDYYEAAKRFDNQPVGDRTVKGLSYHVGDTHTFIADEKEIEAKLVAVTEHAYFWVETGANLDETAVTRAAARFEERYYARLINLFGTIWTPGMDNDPHFTIMHLKGSVDADELGYFTDANQYPHTIYQDSNEQEMIFLNMASLDVEEDLYYGTMVHEVQHLIQWNMDPNESSWMNEGLSQLAEIYNGLQTADTEEYLRHPDTQLNSWPYDDTDTIDAHYAAAYLFCVYVWEQLGDPAVQELSRHPANGLTAVRSVLAGFDPNRSLEEFVADWAAANYLDSLLSDGDSEDSRYHYNHLDLITPHIEEHLTDTPYETTQNLNQYGMHYIDLRFPAPVTLSFVGDTYQALVDEPPSGDSQMWYAAPMDDTNAHLTASFDLTQVEEASLEFNVWYDLEEDWDFAYLAISTDEGKTWELLSPEHRSAGEFGPGWNGKSSDVAASVNGWLKEEVSLNNYVGRNVLLRFETLTDSAVLGRGFAVDDIAIPQLNFQTTVDDGDKTWSGEGFVQTGWRIPQQWTVELIQKGDNPTVTLLPLNEWNQGEWRIEPGEAGSVLVIIPQTPFTETPADYWLRIRK